jgi:hypothetical protein
MYRKDLVKSRVAIPIAAPARFVALPTAIVVPQTTADA